VKFVLVKDHGDVRVVSMDRPKANAIHEGLVRELSIAFREAHDAATVRSVVLTSAQANYFSVGFDVREVFDYDRDRMLRFWSEFIDLYEAVYDFPKPVVAALPGHTFAGGIILALACDFRVMAGGAFGLGVSGINLGIPLPVGVMNMAVNTMGPGHARRLFLSGETVSPEQALAMGLVQALVPAAEVQGAGLALAEVMGNKSPAAFRAIHRMFDSLSGRDTLGSDKNRLDDFVHWWFNDDAKMYRARVRAQVARGG
jgi:enoyl-CoA hydratase/carnithine racemase